MELSDCICSCYNHTGCFDFYLYAKIHYQRNDKRSRKGLVKKQEDDRCYQQKKENYGIITIRRQ